MKAINRLYVFYPQLEIELSTVKMKECLLYDLVIGSYLARQYVFVMMRWLLSYHKQQFYTRCNQINIMGPIPQDLHAFVERALEYGYSTMGHTNIDPSVTVARTTFVILALVTER